jgi:hypothetical protein
MEARKVDKTVGGQEEVRDDRCDSIEVSNDAASNSKSEGQKVSSPWLISSSDPMGKILDVRKELVFTESLEYLGGRN